MTGPEKTTVIENNELLVTLTNQGGTFKEIQLKKFKTYYQEPLYLVTPSSNKFSLLALYEGKEIDLYKLYYQTETRKKGDSTLVIYSAHLGEKATIRHTYSIPPTGYEIRYRLEAPGVTNLSGDVLSFQWIDQIPVQERTCWTAAEKPPSHITHSMMVLTIWMKLPRMLKVRR
jgi:YidC/Oxa1 family membrane protein insertase